MRAGSIPRFSESKHRWLGRLCPLPDPYASLEEFQRAQHEDLDAMTLSEIDAERVRLILRLSLERNPDPWFRERQARLESARRRLTRR